MVVLRSYVNGSWFTPTDEGAPLYDAVTNEEVARISSAGIDMAAALEYGRQVGGAAIRQLTFHERASALKSLASALRGHRDELYQLSARAGATRRDAVFDVDESLFFGDYDGDQVSLVLVSDPSVTALGHVREVSPAIDPKSSTVRIKVAIENPPAAMTLGSAIAGTARSRPAAQIAVPWTALMSLGSKPAVWTVDPATKTVSPRIVEVAAYEVEAIVIKEGLKPGDCVVVDGGKLLSSGQSVIYDEGAS